ncbi:aspartate aminotransferase family protein [Rhodospirillum rubrum]|uniref:aspartate aminotransferase family protein n=1 Tax=Rhodospirillum rubrum TaxID=1085 RepID=UPI0019054CB4|nr:aspartate aminotransferase family protein [Rhodospirillum rubrum]MBK1665150.1 aspartate aminotransferase family protein [Rhodospirillum rubrum]MBK1676395.1 aspartate aminotransferase family protein [Rhodospirillum rubrum]
MTVVDRGTAHWQKLDADHHWHPFTNTKALNQKGARVIVRGEGVYLWDSEGNRILDGMAGLWCVNLGYGRAELAEAAAAQFATLPFYNTFFQTTHTPAVELAHLIASVTPGDLNHVFFASSGSEAVDTALRMARAYWVVAGKPSKTWVIGRKNAYHGSTLAGASLSGMSGMWKYGAPLVPDIAHIAQPYWYGEADAAETDPEAFGLARARLLEAKILELGAENVAAFIGEPIQGAGGVIVPPASYWPEIERICRKYDVLLIADEVICGFGRTGSWFGSQTFGITPDIMTMAKGLSSGYLPISAVAVGNRVADELINGGGEFTHGFTYSGHPVSAAVAKRTIEILRDEKIIERVHDDIGPYFQERLRTLEDHPLVGKVDGVGLIAGIALVASKSPKRFFEKGDEVGLICRDHCFAEGLVMRAVGSRMVCAPPLIISRDEVDELVRLARRCFDLTLRDVGPLIETAK